MTYDPKILETQVIGDADLYSKVLAFLPPTFGTSWEQQLWNRAVLEAQAWRKKDWGFGMDPDHGTLDAFAPGAEEVLGYEDYCITFLDAQSGPTWRICKWWLDE